MNLLILVLTGTLVLSTIIPLSRSPRWWIRVLDFPRLQLLFLASIPLALGFFYGEGFPQVVAIVLSTTCLVYHLYWIYPYTPLAKVEVKRAPPLMRDSTISILTANVLMTNRNAASLLDIVRQDDPDLLLALETDEWWERQLTVLEKDYPYTVKCPLDNLYGMHVYSKLALNESKIEYLVQDDVPSIHTEIELTDRSRIRAHFVHPYPPVPEYSNSSGERDAELLVIARSLQECDVPIIVAGDLNDVAWSETTRLFRKISGLLDPRVGRVMYNTFNAKHWFLRWPLDHLFHSNHFRLKNISRLGKFGSDHFALYTQLVLCHKNPSTTQGLATDDGDEEFANQRIDQHDVDITDVPFNEAEK